MTITITLPTAANRQAVFEKFADHDAVRHAVSGAEYATPAIGFNRLYDYAMGMGADTASVEQALSRNAGLRADLRALLVKVSLTHLPEVAAAGTGELESRQTDQCSIRIEPSRAEPDQVYLIIELSDLSAAMPGTLFTCTADDKTDRLELPEARDGVIQLLLDRSAPILVGLRDHSAEVFLR
jgi:hypothetical protein